MDERIRGEHFKEVAKDPWEKKEQEISQQDVDHIVSDDGAVDSFITQKSIASGCGHLKPPIGFCSDEGCTRTSCEMCHGICQIDMRPICPRHSKFLQVSSGVIRVCEPCYEKAKRKKFLKFFLSFLISFDDGK